jgi:hypothetical protein
MITTVYLMRLGEMAEINDNHLLWSLFIDTLLLGVVCGSGLCYIMKGVLG